MQVDSKIPLWRQWGRRLKSAVRYLTEWPLRTFSSVGDSSTFESSHFSWNDSLERHWQDIRQELDEVLESRVEIPNFQDISPPQEALNKERKWRTFMLYGYGYPSEENCRRCPKTVALLKQIPNMTTAMFSILAPGKHIPAHRGPHAGVLRYHLGLIVPEPKEECRIRVDRTIMHWEEGKGIFFDDSYDHEVWNDTEGQRVVLFVDFMRPLPFPINLYNRLMVQLIAWSPFVQEARKRQDEWVRRGRESVKPAQS